MCGTPHPGCFGKRVWICLIAKGLSFATATKSLQEYERNGFATKIQRAPRRSRAEWLDPLPTRCICVNAVDKGVSERFGVKAVDKGLRARDEYGKGSGCWLAETPNGATVTRTLTKGYRIRVYLSSDKLRTVD